MYETQATSTGILNIFMLILYDICHLDKIFFVFVILSWLLINFNLVNTIIMVERMPSMGAFETEQNYNAFHFIGCH